MIYEIHLLDKTTKKMIHHFDSVFVPVSGDIITLPPAKNGVCFVVETRMLPDTDSNRMVCFGSKHAIGNVF